MKNFLTQIFLFLLLVSTAFAQADDVKGGFFDEGFSDNPIGSTEIITREPASPSPANQQPSAPVTPEPSSPEISTMPEVSPADKIRSNAEAVTTQTKEILKQKFNLDNAKQEDSVYQDNQQKNWAVSPSLGADGDDLTDAGSKISYVSLIVPVGPERQLTWELNKLITATKRENVRVGQVVIVGLEKMKRAEMDSIFNRQGFDPKSIPQTIQEYSEIVKKKERERDYKVSISRRDTKVNTVGEALGFKRMTDTLAEKYSLFEKGIVAPKDLIERLEIKSLPAWIIRSNGVDHVFEGIQNPASFFDEYGRFAVNDQVTKIIDPKYTRVSEIPSLKRDSVKTYIHEKTGDGIPIFALGNLENEHALISNASAKQVWESRIEKKAKMEKQLRQKSR